MLAKSRTDSDTMRTKCESVSRTTSTGFSQPGDGGTQDLKYGPTPFARMPSTWVMKTVRSASARVTEMLDVAA
jgi:hypothetical protein